MSRITFGCWHIPRTPEPTAAYEATQLLEAMEPRYREALVLTKLQGRSLAEAATVAGVSVTAMKTRVYRAIRQARAILNRDSNPMDRKRQPDARDERAR